MPKPVRGAPFAQSKSDCIVSVFIPTRGRPAKLRRAIASLYQTAAHPNRIEILLRVDDDDRATLEIVNSLPVTALIGPRGRGYLDIHKHHHDMAREAQGNWFFVFNDDAIMLTRVG